MKVARCLLVGLVAVGGACADVSSDQDDLTQDDIAAAADETGDSEESVSDPSELRWRRRDSGVADAGIVVDSSTPRADASTPVVDAGKPVDASVPAVDAGKPADASAPVVDASAPVVDASAPVVDAGTSTGVWRPFNASSPWNTLIPANPALVPDSTSLIGDLRSSSPYGEHLDINIARYSIPLFYATANTPTVDVACDIGGLGFPGSAGFNAHAQVPIPSGAAPDVESDHHLLIVDRARNLEWGMWATQNSGGKWTCGVGATADLTGDGLRPYKPQNPTWYTSHGARACGFPLSAGLIRTEEIEAGKIEHALVIAYPHIRSGWYMSPASTAQARSGNDAISTRGIPCGGRVQLDPNLNLDNLGLSRAGRIVAEALQRYGAYVGDFSGAISLYAENSPAAQAKWNGVLDTYEFMDKLDMSKLRVLKFGQLTDDGNGN